MGIVTGSLEDFIKSVVKVILLIAGPPAALYGLYLQFHFANSTAVIQFIIDYAFFMAILYLFYIVNKMDNSKMDKSESRPPK